jgi:hypothetical protein
VDGIVVPLAALLAFIFCALSLLHLYWALGFRGGRLPVLPERDGAPLFQPGPAATLAVAVLLFVAALLVTQRAGLGRALLPASLVVPGCWGVSVALVARAIGEFNYVGFFKRVRNAEFARLDTKYFSPLALFLGLGAGLIAAGGW